MHFLRIIIYFFCLVFAVINCFSQNTGQPYFETDSLANKTYEELYLAVENDPDNKKLSAVYAPYYLKKAQKAKDTLNMVKGFYLHVLHEGKNSNSKYLDSIIMYSKNIEHPMFPWVAYRLKGRSFFYLKDYKNSLENHLLALSHTKDLKKKIHSKISIGILKSHIGRQKEALSLFKECYYYRKKDVDSLGSKANNKQLGYYLNSCVLISGVYSLMGHLDSSSVINRYVQRYESNEALKKYVLKSKLLEAEIHLKKKNFQIAIDSVNKALPISIYLKRNTSLLFSYYLKGVSLNKLGNQKEAIINLKKMDSLFDVIGSFHPQLRPGYEVLINHYKTEKNIKSQLHYIEKLAKFDSIVFDDYAYLSENLTKKIDTPKLIIAKQQELKEKLITSQSNFLWVFIIFSLTVLLLFIVVYRKYTGKLKAKKIEYLKLKKEYQHKFDTLVKESTQSKPENISIANEINSKDIGINTEVVEDILFKLKAFEEHNLFKDTSITAIKLADTFGTNSNYLARIIKFKKGKSFRNYLNDLRLEYALELLRNHRKYKNYSISALANEVGFSNAEPFSKAFYNKMGMYPSEFITKLGSH